MAVHTPAAVLAPMLDGQGVEPRLPSIRGDSASDTVTLKEHVLVRPAASVAVNVWLVLPTGKALPLARPAVCNVDTPGQLSAPMGLMKFTPALQTPASLLTAMLEGQAVEPEDPSMTGASPSFTVTEKEHDAVRPVESVAVNVWPVVPRGKTLPLA